MQISRNLAEYYAKRATYYEAHYHLPERQNDLQTLRFAVKRLLSEHDVLEIACGTGFWTEVIAETARKITAVDINHAVLDMAQKKYYPKENVRFKQENAYILDDISGTFTAGFIGFWFSHIAKEKMPIFLNNFTRNLLPNAFVMIIDDTREVSHPDSYIDSHGNTYQIRRLIDNQQYEILKNFYTEKELIKIVDPIATDVSFKHLKYYWSLCFRLR